MQVESSSAAGQTKRMAHVEEVDIVRCSSHIGRREIERARKRKRERERGWSIHMLECSMQPTVATSHVEKV